VVYWNGLLTMQILSQWKLDVKYSERVQLPAKTITDCITMGCAVNGTAVAAVLINLSLSFMNLHIRYVHWIAARLLKCEIWGVCR